eukprot:1375178-Prymnesium_polylepis.3
MSMTPGRCPMSIRHHQPKQVDRPDETGGTLCTHRPSVTHCSVAHEEVTSLASRCAGLVLGCPAQGQSSVPPTVTVWKKTSEAVRSTGTTLRAHWTGLSTGLETVGAPCSPVVR